MGGHGPDIAGRREGERARRGGSGQAMSDRPIPPYTPGNPGEGELAGAPVIRNFTMNFGPQHPAPHVVMRLVLEMDGEIIDRADPPIVLLHLVAEKLIEYQTYLQALPHFDPLVFLAP